MKILDINVDNLNYQQTLEAIRDFIKGGGKHYIVTTNPEMVVQSLTDKNFAEILNGADLSVADGWGIVWATRILGQPLSERVAGVDLMYGMSLLASQEGYSVFLLGGEEKVAEEAAQKLAKVLPNLKIAGAYSGSPNEKDDDQSIEMLNSNKMDILFVAFGAGKQEKRIARNLDKIPAKVAIGVGGAFDYLSERKKRAPRVVQKIGFEWLYRLAREPWRWRRQLVLPYFAYKILRQRIKI